MTRILNLGFHGIGAPRGRDFGDGEAEYWISQESLHAVLDAAVGREDVTLSFDDGNVSDVEVVLPALLERGLTATFFIVAGWLGRPGTITGDDVRTLAGQGMTIGNHGMAHLRWSQLSPEELSDEVHDGRERLERLTGSPVETVAIPYGDYDDRVLGHLFARGYDRVFTSGGGLANSSGRVQPREHVRASWGQDELERLLGLVA